MTTIDVEGLRPRCPFCHEDIDPGAAQRACESCRAWHHRDCFREAEERCCACGQAAAEASSRRALMRLYVGSVLSTWLLVLLAVTAALSWGLGLDLVISALLGNGLGATLGYGLSRLLDRFAGFSIEAELEPEFIEKSLPEAETFSPQKGLKDMALGMLSLYALAGLALLLDEGLGRLLAEGSLRRLAVGLSTAAIGLAVYSIVKKRRAKPAPPRSTEVDLEASPALKKAAPPVKEKA